MPSKSDLRREILERRRRRSSSEVEDAGLALAEVVRDLLARLPGEGPVAAFLELPGEVPTLPLLAELMAWGRQVLLPTVEDDGTLRWLLWDGLPSSERRNGAPAPRGTDLGPTALTQAALVLVPGLAADTRGQRLGRGRGSYDRSLGERARDALAVVVVWDDEILDEVPVEDHDQPVDAIATPRRLIEVPRA